MTTASDFGKNLNIWRERRGWSMGMLAMRSGVARSTISKLESGARVNAGSSTMRKLAVALDVPVSTLAGEDGSPISAATIGPVRLIPIANVRASAGGHSWTLTGDAIPADDSWSVGKDLVGYVVSGDCMEPEIMDGDLVAIDRAEIEPRPGDVVIVVTEEGPVVKRYVERNGDPALVDNKGGAYKPSIGTVVGVVREVRRRY